MTLFKRCENCNRLKFRWTVKNPKVYVKMLGQWVTGRRMICGKCRKVVQVAINERNV